MKHSIRHSCLPLVVVFTMAATIAAQQPNPFPQPQQQQSNPFPQPQQQQSNPFPQPQQPEVIDGPSSSLYAARKAMQSASMNQRQPGAPMLGSSWYETPIPPPKEVRKGDLIKIRVDLGSKLSSDGQIQRRKASQWDALLNDWVLLNGLRNVKPDPQADGDQRIRGTHTQLYRATGELDTTESIKFNITATVADILPNGNVVLEAHWKINSNDEQWVRSLSGIVARENIGPGNLVLGEDVADLHIGKQEIGHVRDAYKRGWVTRLLDVFSPF
ncbi:flagellar basal body L-ring protein FlgH [Anatilimnocola floriformis]|uniref:flagellar basal body L-ring protein FlgH n=1 Tax=Anatilimnocola floriformis TaxID=2948575 RepID=UPI0020C55468|nr:flagellar basal body L-ring protein FlgH [Anatilimnocola floriformis]